MRSFRLKARCGVGIQLGLAVQAKAIARSGRRGDETGEIAVRLSDEGKDALDWTFENYRDGSPARRPNAKMRASVRL